MFRRNLIFLDTETTGLNPDTDELVELSYAVGPYGKISTLFFGVEEVPPFIDNLIKFSERNIAGLKSDVLQFQNFVSISHGQTMVASNPAFDKAFLEKAGLWFMHYRMLDLETYSMPILDFKSVPSQVDIVNKLDDLGYTTVSGDHTSKRDVWSMQEIWQSLQAVARDRRK